MLFMLLILHANSQLSRPSAGYYCHVLKVHEGDILHQLSIYFSSRRVRCYLVWWPVWLVHYHQALPALKVIINSSNGSDSHNYKKANSSSRNSKVKEVVGVIVVMMVSKATNILQETYFINTKSCLLREDDLKHTIAASIFFFSYCINYEDFNR